MQHHTSQQDLSSETADPSQDRPPTDTTDDMIHQCPTEVISGPTDIPIILEYSSQVNPVENVLDKNVNGNQFAPETSYKVQTTQIIIFYNITRTIEVLVVIQFKIQFII